MNPLIEDLRELLKIGPAAVLLRHAERHHIADPTTGNDVCLTENGRVSAHQLGCDLAELIIPGDSVKAGHSPVLRCEQTVVLIENGISSRRSIQIVTQARDHLGGAYLRNAKAALELARDEGNRFVRRWFNDELPTQLITPFHEAAETQIEEAIRAVDGCRLAVLVTHDWNIMLAREHAFGIRHEDVGWPDYLEGIVIAANGDQLTLAYKGRRKHLRRNRNAG